MRRAFLAGLAGLGVAARPRKALAFGGSGAINVKDYGAIGDGVADDTATLQAIFDTAPARSGIYFPRGPYRVTGTLDWGTGVNAKGFTVYGDGQGKPGNQYKGGSVITGHVPAPLLKCAYPASGITFGDIGFANTHPTGTALQVGGNTITLERLSISGYRGIWAPENTFTYAIRSVQCVWAGNPVGSVGIQVSGHAVVQSADVVGFDHGIRACGNVDIRGCRIEVNRTGIILGLSAAGLKVAASGVIVEDCSFEANDIGLHFYHANFASIRGTGALGGLGSPSLGSKIGFLVELLSASEIAACGWSGTFSEAAVRILPQPAPVNPDVNPGTQRWSNCVASNNHVTGKRWDVATQPPPAGRIVFDQCGSVAP